MLRPESWPGSVLPRDLAAFARGVRGRALLALSRSAEAIGDLKSAAAGFDSIGGSSLERAVIHWALARALAAVDRRKSARARAEASKALVIYAAFGDDLAGSARAEADAVRRWLGATR